MEYIDTIKLDNGNRINRYWNYQPNKQHWLNFGGKREVVEIKIT